MFSRDFARGHTWPVHPTVDLALNVSCHIFKKNKNGSFIFDFFGSDPSKMDQT